MVVLDVEVADLPTVEEEVVVVVDHPQGTASSEVRGALASCY